MKLRIPSKLKVGGVTYDVVKKKKFTHKNIEFSGFAKHRQALIELALTCEGEEYNEQKIDECFIHELLHCIDDIYNSQKLKEDTISRLSQGLYQVLKDNKLYA